MRRLTSSLMMIAGLLLVGSAARAVDITECGQLVPPGETGVLQADLDCEASPGPSRCSSDLEMICSSASDCPLGACLPAPGVNLGDFPLGSRAQLELNGHSIRGARRGIVCYVRRCTILGPGEVSGTGDAIRAFRGHLTVENVVLSESGYGIRTSHKTKVQLTDVLLRDNTHFGANVWKLRATNLSAIGNRIGIDARTIEGTNITVENNEVGLGGSHLLRKATIDGLEATNNSIAGVWGARMRLQNSLLENNGVDLRTRRRPRLVNTTWSNSEVCERARRRSHNDCTPTGESWQVCTND